MMEKHIHGKGRFDRNDRKLNQLCRQIQQRMNLVFAGDCDDPLLEGLYVQSVIAADRSNLIVEIVLAKNADHLRLQAILQRLNAMRGFLRSEIAAAIHRKRTPQLMFQIIHPSLLTREEEQMYGFMADLEI